MILICNLDSINKLFLKPEVCDNLTKMTLLIQAKYKIRETKWWEKVDKLWTTQPKVSETPTPNTTISMKT